MSYYDTPFGTERYRMISRSFDSKTTLVSRLLDVSPKPAHRSWKDTSEDTDIQSSRSETESQVSKLQGISFDVLMLIT